MGERVPRVNHMRLNEINYTDAAIDGYGQVFMSSQV